MTYTALYRRYRPNCFQQLVGQEHIGKILRNAVAQDSFVHAYLFAGPRGTGKTSAAKIMSRAVNCLAATAGEPCGQCAACRRALNGESMDILEIDAASNRGIDEIRDLRERVKYLPVQEKYKVYIIDEVHMLTPEAFNALLKTLEEPPAHILFILATTEPHKIPLTVLSRCQRFDFRPISEEAITNHLLHIADQEKIPLDPTAAALIARKANGGMRDAIGLLDQAAATAEGRIVPEQIARLTGSVDRFFIYALIKTLVQNDTAALLNLTGQLAADGRDIRAALGDLLEETRDLLLLRLNHQGEEQLPEWALATDTGVLIALLTALADTDSRLRYAPQPQITLELALLKACAVINPIKPPAALPPPISSPPAPTASSRPAPTASSPPAATASNPPAATASSSPAPTASSPPATTASSRPAPTASNRPAPTASSPSAATASSSPAATASSPPAATASSSPAATLEQLTQLWPEILRQIYKVNLGTYFFVAEGKPGELSHGKLTLFFPPGYEIHMESACHKPAHKNLIEEKIYSGCGQKLQISGKILTPPSPTASPSPELESTEEEEQGSLF